jgi:AcrR family transcriptional regulator
MARAAKPSSTRPAPAFDVDVDHATRERLIQAAIALAELEGPGSVGLREAARRAGVTHAAPYRHFADREALLVAVAERGFRELLAHCLAHDAGGDADDPLRRFWSLGIGYFTFAITRPGIFRVMFSPEAARASSLRTAEGAVFSLCVSSILSAQRAGKVAPGDPQLQALVAWSAMHGAAMLYLDGLVRWVGLEAPPEALARELATQVFRGLRP